MTPYPQQHLDTETSAFDKRALIVEDDASHRKLYVRILGAKGFGCDAAETASEARALLDAGAYDLMVADIVMPGESGLDLVAEIQGTHPDMAVIMASGMDDPDIYSRAAALGVYGYLIKPISKNQLLATVESAWIRLRLERERRGQTRKLEELLADRDAKVLALEAAKQTILDQQERLIKKERQAALLQLAGAAAHEINQPLMVILGHLELMAMDRDNTETMAAHATTIKAAAERISGIIKKIQHLRSDQVIHLNVHDSIIDLHHPRTEDTDA